MSMAEPFKPDQTTARDTESKAGGVDADRDRQIPEESPLDQGDERSDLDAPPFRAPKPGAWLASKHPGTDNTSG